jgi:hypothetical protein
MNWKAILAPSKRAFTGAILRIAECICFLIFCSISQAANITFNGHLYTVFEDQGGAIYSGAAENMLFSGAINDATLEGFIADLMTNTPIHCCIGDAEGLLFENNEPLEAENAALLSTLTGSSYVAGDVIDLIIFQGGVMTAGGGLFFLEVVMVFDANTYANNGLGDYPPDQNDILVSLFFIEEVDNQDETLFEAVGVIDELSFTADDFSINAGLNDAWVSADAPFQGFFFTVFPDTGFFFMSWFTFDFIPPVSNEAFFGASDQRWVTGGGAHEGGSVMIRAELTSGGVFNGSVPLATQQAGYGTIRIGFINCSEAILHYAFPSADLSGQVKLSRVLPDNVALCQALAGQ